MSAERTASVSCAAIWIAFAWMPSCTCGNKPSSSDDQSTSGTPAGPPPGTTTTCFPGETKVRIPGGEAWIADLDIGDVVVSWDFDQNRPVEGVVVGRARHVADRLLELNVDGAGTVRTTANHPIFTYTRREWVPAGELRDDEQLARLENDHLTPVRASGTPVVVEPTTVYDITVVPEHNFFADDILVHNKSFTITFDWSDDGADPEDVDNDGIMDVGCGDSVDVSIIDPLQAPNWTVGMADIDGAWTGEDCFNGDGPTQVCHAVSAPTAVLQQVCNADDVVSGSSTFLHASRDPFLTYYVSDGYTCFVFGNDIGYYAALGCVEMR